MRRFAIGLGLGLFLTGTAVWASLSSPLWGTAYEDLRYPLTAVKLGPANPPQFAQWRDDGAGSAGVYSYYFEDEAVNPDQIFINSQMPHSWKEGDDIYPHAHVSPEDATTCNFRICLEYVRCLGVGACEATTSELCNTFASGEVATDVDLEYFGTTTMTGYEISALIFGRVYRDSTNAADTCTGKHLWIHDVDYHYNRDRPGSRFEMAK